MLEIRQENVNDYEQVYNVIKTAFEMAEHRDGNEQDLVISLRKSKSFIPELSLVAVKDNKVIVYLIYDKITLRVCKRIFHPRCIKIGYIEIIGRWNI